MNLTDFIKQYDIDEEKGILDLTDESSLNKINKLSELLYSKFSNSVELNTLEKLMVKNKNDYSLIAHSSVKIAKSKRFLSEIDKKIYVTVIFAVYKEHLRILKKSEHEYGEDFLMRKISQLQNLFGDFKNITWEMLIVDDGCPENSGKIAEKILEERYSGNNVKVLYLQDALDQELEVVNLLKKTDDSRKGGAVEYGMWYAAQQKKNNHIIIYTDADLSTHLGQCGLLINSIIHNKMYTAIASRRETESVVLKEGTRNLRGKLFIYLWKRMLRRLNYIVDTQCGFKAFRADIVNKIILDNQEKKFAFDIELLLKIDILKRGSIEKIPIAWIDSKEASTTTDFQPYLDMLKSIADMYHNYLSANAVSHMFAFFIKTLTQEEWDILIKNVPEGIRIKSAVHYDIFCEITVEDFKDILVKNLNK